jgi:L-alanine-DL-glutamate epimerase-like enolase superfamily enzyme
MMSQSWLRGAVAPGRRIDARSLAHALSALVVQVDSVICRFGGITVAAYPGGQRPTCVVALSGRGETGYGELVAFTAEEQRAFADRASALLLHKGAARPIAESIAPAATNYERAALESALIDLALRQQRLSLRDLCGGGAVPRISDMRWVSSFGQLSNPGSHLRAVRSASHASEFKIDVDPSWPETVIAELVRESGVVILDFKDGGNADLVRRLSARFPSAIFEDPPGGAWHGQVARDRSLLSPADVEAALQRGEMVNLKIPRMGGPIPLLEAVGIAQKRGGHSFYFGGMFEVGPGREQARQLAALFCGTAPNDLGPILGAMSPPRPRSPSWVRLDTAGFGATCAWSQLVPSPL